MTPDDQNLPTAVLWDMDGTIVDTEPYWFESEYELVAKHGTSWNDHHAHQLIGKDLTWSADYLRDHGGVQLPQLETVHLLQDGVIARLRENTVWRPGARELITELSRLGVPQALVTMSWAGLAWAVVEQFPQGTFASVVSGDRVPRGKPDPAPYLLAMEELGVEPNGVVALEDSPTGLASAVAAGVRVIGVPHMIDLAESGLVPGTFRLVESLAQLTAHDLLR